MSEITGYIDMPFHGESAYEIAKRYGYGGTEKEWLDSLGFIPDKSIGGEKLKEELVETLKKYETFIGEVFDEKKGFSECGINEYTSESEEYVVPYCLIGQPGKYTVAIPKLTSSNTFDEEDANAWSQASGSYRLAKIDVSAMAGKTIKISGFARSVPSYPLAFCVDEGGSVLVRFGDGVSNCMYGYKKTEQSPDTVSEAEAITATVPENSKYMYIGGSLFTSAGVAYLDTMPKLEVMYEERQPSETYKLMQSPLWGKKLYVDGDSICYGNGYKGGFGKIIADRYNMELVNNAVGGAPLCSGVCEAVAYGKEMDWENNKYYLKLTHCDPENTYDGSVYMDGMAIPMTKELYENGYGVYPTLYKLVDGVLTELEYTEELPLGTYYVKFEQPTYGDNSTIKYAQINSYKSSDGTIKGNYWLWEAYKSGFKAAHEANPTGNGIIGVARHWLSAAVEEVDPAADYIIFEGGVNDYLMNRRLGELTKDMTGVVDTTTVIGAMEHICRRLLEKCQGKKLLYVITHKSKTHAWTKNRLGGSRDYKTWTDYHDAILSVLRKYSIPYVDLFEASAFNTEMSGFLKYTINNDGVHPNKDGYELFYVPQIVSKMEKI
ncbi:MAG: SGNH/GDSL hydrolase family protein [Clostridia bacterium]|nr:SGNH/GDSL hydrolase family protein [Clostridia bacterium]